MVTKIAIIPDGGITSPQGFCAGAVAVGIKKTSTKLDLAVLFSEVPAMVAGVFTTNRVKAAPVVLSQQRVSKGKAAAVVVNSGCANACTGEVGFNNAMAITDAVAQNLGISPEKVLTASTGVIGEQLPVDKIKAGIGQIVLSKDSGHEFARAIMTTDTQPKEIAVKVEAGDVKFTVAGAAKGAGMIHPNMATLLGFVTTDAAVEPDFLRSALRQAADVSFNLISVDGDTSTNDTLLILANGCAANKPISADSPLAATFQQALEQVCIHLAKSIARDGEGATKLIEVTVNGASNVEEARQVARTIISSPLVKTAVHGNDPNWGRVLAAAGRSGVNVEEAKVTLHICDTCVLKNGQPVPTNKQELIKLLNNKEVKIKLELNLGTAQATAWGCDLSKEYVTINAEYTT